MGLKLVLSNFISSIKKEVYETFCLTVDILFHCMRGYTIPTYIDYCRLAIYHREMMAKHIGVKHYHTDDAEKMKHVKNLFGKEGDHTKFTYHNVEWHIIFDHLDCSNINHGQCKTLEKTNKRTKDAIRNGKIGLTDCQKIMEYRVKEFVFQYLVEGNAVRDDGTLDPICGKHRINDKILKQANTLMASPSWFSVFYDQQHNPSKPEYVDGCILKVKISNSKMKLFVSVGRVNVPKLIGKVFDDYISNTVIIVESIHYFKYCNYWRNRKKYIIGIGSIIIKKNTDKKKKGALELCMVTGIGMVNVSRGHSVKVIFGHPVTPMYDYVNGERNIRGYINKAIVCWKIEDVFSNAYYMHLCQSDKCVVVDDQIKHDWESISSVSLFWYLGVGKSETLGNPLMFFDNKMLHYRMR